MPGPPVQFGEPLTNANVRAGFNFIPNGVEEKNLYFYHPDHLGSSSYITDREGQIIQHTEYIAFGEVLVDEHSTTNNMPYLFNGKELDYETGLYYYGARYYDPKTSLWLNVDPLAEKYPTMSPYSYVANNPINAIDPDGRDVIILSNRRGANRLGHQAILIGNDKNGWIYISKDGSDNGGIYGDSRFMIKHYKSLNEFKNSPHNFEVKGYHSNVGGGENENIVFKLDKNGNKIQRYDQAYRIDTDDKYDAFAASKAAGVARGTYCLTAGDCSDIPTAFLNYSKTPEGEKLKNGEGYGDILRIKQFLIEQRNKGEDYDIQLKPTSLQLQEGEKGEK